jgi:hypothetical protein
VASEHVQLIYVSRVPRISRDIASVKSEVVVIVFDRHYPFSAAPTDLALPKCLQRTYSSIDKDLNGVFAACGVGQIRDGEIATNLGGGRV